MSGNCREVSAVSPEEEWESEGEEELEIEGTVGEEVMAQRE